MRVCLCNGLLCSQRLALQPTACSAANGLLWLLCCHRLAMLPTACSGCSAANGLLCCQRLALAALQPTACSSCSAAHGLFCCQRLAPHALLARRLVLPVGAMTINVSTSDLENPRTICGEWKRDFATFLGTSVPMSFFRKRRGVAMSFLERHHAGCSASFCHIASRLSCWGARPE